MCYQNHEPQCPVPLAAKRGEGAVCMCVNRQTKKYVSDRETPLIYTGQCDKPVVTIERYIKWYNLFVVHPDGRVEKVNYPIDVLKEGSPFVDHVPNPDYVVVWANQNNYLIDSISYEVMVGRWFLEARDTDEIKHNPDMMEMYFD